MRPSRQFRMQFCLCGDEWRPATGSERTRGGFEGAPLGVGAVGMLRGCLVPGRFRPALGKYRDRYWILRHWRLDQFRLTLRLLVIENESLNAVRFIDDSTRLAVGELV